MPSSGPVRVCNECRYHIVVGAILDEGPAPIEAIPNTRDSQVQVSEEEKKTNADGLQPLIVRWEGLAKPMTTIQVDMYLPNLQELSSDRRIAS